ATTGDTTGDTTTGEPACDAETPVILYLSPDDSNSMSSPVQVRESILSEWASLYGVPIRAWEFFNYYTFGYPAAPAGQVVVTPELLQVEGAPEGEYVLQIGVSSPALDNAARPPMNITLVLDESGSMSGTPMDMEKESCRAIAASLKAGDVVSMVGWDTQNAVKLAGYKVAGPNDPNLLAKIEGLEAGGGTDLHGGLVAGYELAQQVYDPTRINRIVLISDGGANAGITDIDTIAMAAGDNNGDGIYMVGVGVGEAGYNDALMDSVTDAGKGASVFIPNKEEAWKVFGDDFVNTMAVAARDVQVRLDLPPGFEIVKFSGEEYSADPEEVEPQHLAPNDAMVFHQTIATCAPQLVSDETLVTVTARYKDAVTFEQKEVSAQVSFGELLGEASPLVRKGKAVFEYTEALKATRDNAVDAKAQVDAAIGFVDVALAANPGDGDLAEIKSILQAL
ncbi:MAG TPA: VWA domain-containing protein, partial [Nannocystaceae bacterium]|nr:VWA domain-containing protein [Nannocystaceae bacterium]